MTTLQKFCEERKLSTHLEEAFTMYVRSTYAQKFMLKTGGDTIQMVVKKLTDKQVKDAWNEFVNEMKNTIAPG